MGRKDFLKQLPLIKQFNAKFDSLYTRLNQMEAVLASIERGQQKLYLDVMQKEKSGGWLEETIRERLHELAVMDASVSYVRVGRDYDGGYVMADAFSDASIAYSFGICDDVSWDLAMAERGMDVFLYDHTIDGLPGDHPNFHYFQTGLAGKNEGVMKTLQTVLTDNGHQHESKMILKMDIEGSEWDVLSETDCLGQFSQIAIEFHGLCDFQNPLVLPVLQKLRETHIPVHIHANNCSPVLFYGELVLPDALEVTYLRKGEAKFSENTRYFPTSLDMENDPSKPEIILGN